METISASEFKATCLALLDKVGRTGQPILVTKRGKPVAQLAPPPPPEKKGSWLGCMRGTGVILGDIVGPVLEEHEYGDADWSNVKKGFPRK
jgi:prevent-host-death family protein